jgi:DNA uptake protein ComE-like DNA-binding protein
MVNYLNHQSLTRRTYQMNRLFARIIVSIVSVLFAATIALAADKKAPAAPAPAAKPAAEAKAQADPKAAPATKAEQVDINSATEADLKTVAGIGDTYAKKIIEGRPYAKKDQLVTRKIVPKAVYDKVKDKIIAKQTKK